MDDEKTPLERARDLLYEATELREHAEAVERAARASFEYEQQRAGQADAVGGTVHELPRRPDPDEVRDRITAQLDRMRSHWSPPYEFGFDGGHWHASRPDGDRLDALTADLLLELVRKDYPSPTDQGS